jgi:hypothetical protein
MIFIAYNRRGHICSIVAARSRELAEAYWQGADVDAITVKSLEEDFTSLDEHPTGVIPVLKTVEKTLSPFAQSPQIFTVVTQ